MVEIKKCKGRNTGETQPETILFRRRTMHPEVLNTCEEVLWKEELEEVQLQHSEAFQSTE